MPVDDMPTTEAEVLKIFLERFSADALTELERVYAVHRTEGDEPIQAFRAALRARVAAGEGEE